MARDPSPSPGRRLAASRRPPIPLAGVAALALAVALVAAGCGGGSGSDGVAVAQESASPASTTGEATTAPTSDADREQAALDFARCMREQGLDFPDPQPDENGRLRFRFRGGPGDQAKFRDASEECRQYMEAARPELTEEERAELYDRRLEFARCMRSEGIEDFPDPQPNAEGPPAEGAAIDLDDPRARAALEACREQIGDVPMLGRRGGPS